MAEQDYYKFIRALRALSYTYEQQRWAWRQGYKVTEVCQEVELETGTCSILQCYV